MLYVANLALTLGGNILGNMLLPGLGGAPGAYVGGIVDQQLFGEKDPEPDRLMRACPRADTPNFSFGS